MRNFKLVKFCSFLYIILFIYWIIKLLPRTQIGQRSSSRGDRSEVTLQNPHREKPREKPQEKVARPPERQHGTENHVLIIGYGKFGIHMFPQICDCQSGKYIVNNDTNRIGEASIVIFTVGARRKMTLSDWRRYHSNRKQSQMWVLGSRESPQTCTAVKPPEDMKSAYNWSMTYHSKADFPTPYGRFHPSDQPESTSVNWYAQKKRLVSWTSSHCPLQGKRYRRQEFVKSLRKHLNITMYGTCGDGRFDGDDYVTAVKEHKFVLVFENSCCSEYISEKFWDALTLFNQVPVVYGATREEYERIAPPGSFIFVQDFKSLRGLTEYINKVGSDEAEYNKFHDWRRLGHVTKQLDPEDRVFHCHSICRMADRRWEVDAGKVFHFNEHGDVFFGGCRDCQEEVDVLLRGG